jgi:hypothetical protein
MQHFRFHRRTRRLRKPAADSGYHCVSVWKCLLQRVEEGSLRLISRRITKFLARRATVPEVAADEQRLLVVDLEVKDRTQSCVCR